MTPLRRRLFSPPNAVPDTGINMVNGYPVLKSRPFKPTLALVPKPFIWPGKLTAEFWLAEQQIPVEKGRAELTVTDIIRIVSRVFDVSIKDLKSQRRTRPMVDYRQVAMALSCRMTLHSLSHIGRMFGGRDHTTCLHAKLKMAPVIAKVAVALDAQAGPTEWALAIKSEIERNPPKNPRR